VSALDTVIGMLIVFVAGFVAGHVRCAWHYEGRLDAAVLDCMTHVILDRERKQ
jgi:hypothetical protein